MVSYKLPPWPFSISLRFFLVPCILVSFLQLNKDAHAAQVYLEWEPSYTYVEGYEVHWGTTSRQYTNRYDVGLALHHYITGLEEDVIYYYAVTAYLGDLKSGYSNEVSSRGSIPASNFMVGNGSSVGCVMTPHSYIGLEWLFLCLFFPFVIFYPRTEYGKSSS
jgi:hypothetical protein